MQTTCPECKTTFRLTQEQLGLRRGLVRCGRCKAVFNAYQTMLPDLITPPAQTVSHVPAPPQPVATSLLESLRDSDLPEPLVTLSAPVPAVPPAPVVPAAAAGYGDSLLLSELPSRPVRAALPLWQASLYVLASGLLLAALLAQLAYFLRADLAAWVPGLRPTLTVLCAQMGCQVPLPHGLDKRAIVASSLEHDAERKSRVRLTLLLANRSGDVQAWPHLMLTLTDVHEAPVALKTFPPDAYLPSGTRPAAGMKAGSEVEVRLDLDLGKLEAAGYSLELTYP